VLAEGAQAVNHPTGTLLEARESLPAYRTLLSADDLTFAHEPLATLGDSLALCRGNVSFGALDQPEMGQFGAANMDSIVFMEVDKRGQRLRTEFFALERLGDAIVRLYERYAELLPEGTARECAAATARAIATVLGPFDLERYAHAIAPDVEFADHRTVGFPSGRGPQELLRSIGSLLESADDVAVRIDDVLALRANGFLVRWTTSGTDRVSRGSFEWQFLRLCVFGPDGLLTRAEQFDVDRADAALARFDTLLRSGGGEPTGPTPGAALANDASRAVERFERCWRARDWNGVVATFAPAHVMDDRRALVRLRLTGEDYFASLRLVFDMTLSEWRFTLLATRGQRLALFHVELTGEAAGSGPLVREVLWVLEVDAEGQRIALVLLDPENLDAAYAELDQRYVAGEVASNRRAELTRAFSHAFATRDWGTLATLLAPGLVVNDHRRLGWDTLDGPAEYIQAVKALVDLAPDVQLRIDHIKMSDPAFLYVTTWLGSHEGGAFEASSAIVCELDARGRICRFDQYDLDQLGDAEALLESIGARHSRRTGAHSGRFG